MCSFFGRDNRVMFWEQSGTSGKIIVTLPEGMKATEAMPVNLRGEKRGEPIKISSGKFEFILGAYGPASFILNY